MRAVMWAHLMEPLSRGDWCESRLYVGVGVCGLSREREIIRSVPNLLYLIPCSPWKGFSPRWGFRTASALISDECHENISMQQKRYRVYDSDQLTTKYSRLREQMLKFKHQLCWWASDLSTGGTLAFSVSHMKSCFVFITCDKLIESHAEAQTTDALSEVMFVCESLHTWTTSCSHSHALMQTQHWCCSAV